MNKEQEVVDLLLSTKREGMDQLIEFMRKRKYFESPASTRFHGNYKGGLMDHCLNILVLLREYNVIYNLNIPDESCIITSLLHDLCKASLYDGNEEIGYKYNGFVGRNGHAKYSISRIERFIKLTDLEKQMIKFHMGYYGTIEFDGKNGEYTIRELCTAQNDKKIKLFYFVDDTVSQCIDKMKGEK